MALAETVLKICTDPARMVSDLGGGNFARGIGVLHGLGQAKKSWSNIAILPAITATSASSRWTATWEVNFPFWLQGLLMKASADDITIDSIKCDGFLMYNQGINVIEGTQATLLVSEVVLADDFNWLMMVKNGAKLTLGGAAPTGASTCTVTPLGWNMELFSGAFGG